MSPNELNEQLKQTVSQLSEPESLHGLFREVSEGDPLPSAPALAEIIDLCRAILFPGFYGKSLLSRETLPYHIGVSLDRLSHLLTQQVLAGLCFQRTEPVETCKLTEKAQTITGEFIAPTTATRLPIRMVRSSVATPSSRHSPATESPTSSCCWACP